MSLLKEVIKETVYVLRCVYEVLYIYPKIRDEEHYEIEEQLNLKK